ncbi:hypothetical protein Cci01nite_34320 [Catellatospora citrea]|uniref:Subtilisin inhibitor-like n=1 Tax=Catellatospora citrea TaxID=53366 RepID=A0A8J3NZH1_9ACTN|nr:hypothetical protein C8E86_2798 [Catellatospora citrea]GIF98338.1 hypothetical protein Cci01nite_34320 [Catellatospora citrea]
MRLGRKSRAAVVVVAFAALAGTALASPAAAAPPGNCDTRLNTGNPQSVDAWCSAGTGLVRAKAVCRTDTASQATTTVYGKWVAVNRDNSVSIAFCTSTYPLVKTKSYETA